MTSTPDAAGEADTKAGPEPVLVIACGALAHELVRIKELNHWDHMDIQCLPAELHNHPRKIPDAVHRKIAANRAKYKTILVGYADCGTGGLLDAVLHKEGVGRLPGAHCYEMFAGGKVFQQLHVAEPGTFYLTDFLTSHFDRLVIKGLGLDRFPQLQEQFFGNYKKLVYLAQRDDGELDKKARDAADYLGFKYRRILTGDRHLESALSVKTGSVRH